MEKDTSFYLPLSLLLLLHLLPLPLLIPLSILLLFVVVVLILLLFFVLVLVVLLCTFSSFTYAMTTPLLPSSISSPPHRSL